MKKNSSALKRQFSLFLPLSRSHRKDLIYRTLPRLAMEGLRRYFRLQLENSFHIPTEGKALICPNHSGFLGFDALILTHEVMKISGRLPRVLSHRLWFSNKNIGQIAHRFGFVEANTTNGLRYLDKDQLIILFPEGEKGNFKPSLEAYQLQEFKRGFVRMALQTQAPIIPVIIIGAEESNINLSQVQLSHLPWLKFSKITARQDIILPLPLNFLPFPARWKIKFLEPILLPYPPEAANDRGLVQQISRDVQTLMQQAIDSELKERKSIFF